MRKQGLKRGEPNQVQLVPKGQTPVVLRLRRLFVFVHDLLWIPGSLALGFWVRFGGYTPAHLLDLRRVAEFAILALICHSITLWWRGCYRGLWRFASIPDLIRLVQAVIVGALLTMAAAFVSDRLTGFPRLILVIYPFILFGGLASGRLLYRVWRDRTLRSTFSGGKRAVIVGSGQAGEALVRDLVRHPRYVPMALVDDDPQKQGREVQGVRVRGRIEDLARVIRRVDADIVLYAMPSVSRQVLRRVLGICEAAKIACLTLPSLADLPQGQVALSALRPVLFDDLLGREPIQIGSENVSIWLADKRVIVTGGGGSIGSELCRQIMRAHPGVRLMIIDNGEYNLYRIQMELCKEYGKRVTCILADVRDACRLEQLFVDFHPQVVFHAAAYKHVPLVEQNPLAGILANVEGTQVVVETTIRHRVERFVMVSTDKAVYPANVMGATKRVAELICLCANGQSSTRFVVTRFGNVLGSSGSVIPHFQKQIAAGGPVTVTHESIMRYFMLIPEAVALVMEAGASVQDGVFVLDMGEPVQIKALAEQLIRLSGLEPGRDIQIVYTGLRPGEKLYEELLYRQERRLGTEHPKLFMAASTNFSDRKRIKHLIDDCIKACRVGNLDSAVSFLHQIVPEWMTPDIALGKVAPTFRTVKPAELIEQDGYKSLEQKKSIIPLTGAGGERRG